MSTTSPSIIRPEISVPIGDTHIVVRELPGELALDFFALLAKHFSSTLAPAISVDQQGKMSADIAQLLSSCVVIDSSAGESTAKIDAERLAQLLAGMIGSVRELFVFLVTNSTEDPQAMKKYGSKQCLALLDAAIEVNLTPDHIELLKKVGARVGAFLGAQKSDTPKSATS